MWWIPRKIEDWVDLVIFLAITLPATVLIALEPICPTPGGSLLAECTPASLGVIYNLIESVAILAMLATGFLLILVVLIALAISFILKLSKYECGFFPRTSLQWMREIVTILPIAAFFFWARSLELTFSALAIGASIFLGLRLYRRRSLYNIGRTL